MRAAARPGSLTVMWESAITSPEDGARFEILPFGKIDDRVAELPRPTRLTITCSPMHGPDRAIRLASRLRALRHSVTVHVAARMVRDRAHLDDLLAAMADAGADDLFLIGGDIDRPMGCYSSAVELLPIIDEHPQRPTMVGVAGYPEDHPLITDDALEHALREKSRHADYVTTQMCFDPDAVRGWIIRHRDLGMKLPVVIGMPGKVARRQLLKMSTKIGVGSSLRFLRKQRGWRNLLTRRSAADRLYEAFMPMLEEPQLGLAGFQYFTFNQLIETWQWHQTRLATDARPSSRSPARHGLVQHGETTAIGEKS